MPLYAKLATDSELHNRPVLLCGWCNCNLNMASSASKGAYLVYTSKKKLVNNEPYDVYCQECFKRHYRKAILVKDEEESVKKGILAVIDELSAESMK